MRKFTWGPLIVLISLGLIVYYYIIFRASVISSSQVMSNQVK